MMILASDLASKLGGTLVGEDREVSRLAPSEQPTHGSVVVVADEKTLQRLESSDLSVLVVPQKITRTTRHPVIQVPDTRLALAQLTQLFDTRPQVAEGVHPLAVIHPSARLEANVHLAAKVVIQANVVIGAGSRIGAGCVVGENVTMGENCLLHPNVTLYANVQLGQRVIVHSGAVIGSDGFGYAPGPRGAVKIHHLGSVRLGNDVEIGANTCIDRGTLADSVIGDRTKIDNHCQIGHNVQIGTDCLIAGRAGISGSVKIGNLVIVGGSVLMADHVVVGDGVTLAGGTGVSKNVPAGETWAGVPAAPFKKWVRGLYLQGQLETMWQVVKKLRGGEKESFTLQIRKHSTTNNSQDLEGERREGE
jgi:UDP-3-O-[3-hydroxymyristoyl] glucosamine N-acyltransferase